MGPGIMEYGHESHHRRSIRLRGYDYSQVGAYFVTICTQDRVSLFGEVIDGNMRLNDAGQTVVAEWVSLPNRFMTVRLDAFIVMPNHFHGIIVVTGPNTGANIGANTGANTGATTGATTRVAPTVGDVVGAFKSRVTVEYIHGVKAHGWPPFPGRLWQRNYYEHIIRDDDALICIRRYICDNPAQWASDREHPHALASGAEDTWSI